jgi:hypothetical protein
MDNYQNWNAYGIGNLSQPIRSKATVGISLFQWDADLRPTQVVLKIFISDTAVESLLTK